MTCGSSSLYFLRFLYLEKWKKKRQKWKETLHICQLFLSDFQGNLENVSGAMWRFFLVYQHAKCLLNIVEFYCLNGLELVRSGKAIVGTESLNQTSSLHQDSLSGSADLGVSVPVLLLALQITLAPCKHRDQRVMSAGGLISAWMEEIVYLWGNEFEWWQMITVSTLTWSKMSSVYLLCRELYRSFALKLYTAHGCAQCQSLLVSVWFVVIVASHD